MRQIITPLAVAACVACLAAPSTSHSDNLPDYPYNETPLVSVEEISPNSNFVIIRAHVIFAKGQLSEQGFVPGRDIHQVQILGDYVCRLFNRQGVVLAERLDPNTLIGTYLVACAL